jgi:GNAT superfamily N-acetyltransferase
MSPIIHGLANVTRDEKKCRGVLSRQDAELEVRLANPSDAGSIAYTAKTASINNLASLNRGFLLYPWTEDQYAALAAEKEGLCLCLLNGETIGFVTGFAGIPLSTAVQVALGGTGRQLVAALSHHADARGDTTWHVVYQMALLPNFRGRGLGLHLMRLYFLLVPGPYYGVVPEKPILSIRRTFWHGCGFRRIGSFSLKGSSSKSKTNQVQQVFRCTSWGLYCAPNQRTPEEQETI